MLLQSRLKPAARLQACAFSCAIILSSVNAGAIGMNPQLKRILGLVLVIVAIVSLIVSVGGVAGLWALKQNAVVAVSDTAALLTETLVTTDRALTAALDVLDGAQTSIATLLGITQSIASALRDGQPTLNSVNRLLSEDLPKTLDSVETAIASASQAATAADDFLREISRIPLLNLNYQPAVPLSQSIADIGQSLGDFPAKLEEIGGGLQQLNDSLAVIATQVDGLGATIRQIDTSLDEMPGVLRDYQRQLKQVLPTLQSIQAGVDQIITFFIAVLTFILLWIIAVQLIVLAVGWRWFKSA
jgi:ABC-type transporter Mla subunit MlaD